jgi:hypothetical protein
LREQEKKKRLKEVPHGALLRPLRPGKAWVPLIPLNGNNEANARSSKRSWKLELISKIRTKICGLSMTRTTSK